MRRDPTMREIGERGRQARRTVGTLEQLTVLVAPEHAAWLHREAHRRGKSASALAREVLAAAMKGGW